ncbi:hypothetical protein MN1_270 [Thermus phage MN1]|nr:hypothetical protein MN1_270 [Thermus phage MN1]
MNRLNHYGAGLHNPRGLVAPPTLNGQRWAPPPPSPDLTTDLRFDDTPLSLNLLPFRTGGKDFFTSKTCIYSPPTLNGQRWAPPPP